MRVIVTFGDDPEKHVAEMRQYGRVVHVSRRAKSIILDLYDGSHIQELEKLPYVTQIAVDRAFKPSSSRCAVNPPSRITNAYARSLMGAPKPFEATAIRVAVIDTGIADTDRINVIKRVKVIDEETEDKNHGTWVAHTIAGYPVETNVGTVEGVVPGNPIIDAPVIYPDGYTTMSTILMALDAVADEGATVINMSLSSPSLCSQATNNMLESLAKEGILMAVAGGNFGNNHFIGCPANSPYTIAVGSVYFCPPDKLPVSSFSTEGPDIVAIGGEVNPEQLIAGLGMERPIAMAGTSMATPFVTGALTVMKSLYPELNIAGARYVLATTSTKPPHVPDPYYGYGVLNFNGVELPPEKSLEESPFYPQAVEVLSTGNLALIALGGAILWLLMKGYHSSKVDSASSYV